MGPGGSDAGTIFKLLPSGGQPTHLHTFSGGTDDGASPYGALMQATDGNLYGTTSLGGAFNAGTVFRITTAGAFTLLHSFIPSVEGTGSVAALVPSGDGNFVGIMPSEGSGGMGTVFKVSPTGNFTVLYTFRASNAEGDNPAAALLQATDGNFYGTTALGGDSGVGTVFKMTPSGSVTLLHSFTGGTDGKSPLAPLMQASDGTLYGTTSLGASGAGTVFKFTPAGQFAIIYTVPSDRGVGPVGQVVEGRDGNLYVTTQGAAPNFGTIFRLAPDGTATASARWLGELDRNCTCPVSSDASFAIPALIAVAKLQLGLVVCSGSGEPTIDEPGVIRR